MQGRPGYDFSFSGLKTALRHALSTARRSGPADLAAAYQAAIVRSLVTRTAAALDATGHTAVALVGGVAANSVLRDAFAAHGRRARRRGARGAAGALHRQRGDDRLGRPLHAGRSRRRSSSPATRTRRVG